MKLPRLQKLNALGVTHILVPLLAIVAIGGIGSYLLTASHADTTEATCSYNGKTNSGRKEYNCKWASSAPVISSTTNKGVGTLPSGTNWVICQRQTIGSTYHASSSKYDNWWAYTESNEGTWGWVNGAFASGTANNHTVNSSAGSFSGVPQCPNTTAYGAPPYLSSGTSMSSLPNAYEGNYDDSGVTGQTYSYGPRYATTEFAPGTFKMSDNGGCLVFQTDGNLVVYLPSSGRTCGTTPSSNSGLKAIWSSGTGGHLSAGGHLALQNDGNIVIYGTGSDNPVGADWASGTSWGKGNKGDIAYYDLEIDQGTESKAFQIFAWDTIDSQPNSSPSYKEL